MAKIVEKITELEFDELATLGVIEQDADLTFIFMDDTSMSFNMLRTLAKENKLSETTKENIRSIFDKIILTKPNLIDKYLRLTNASGVSVKVEEPVVEANEEPKVEEPVKKPRKPKREVELPRRYGKELIDKDIQNQGGKATNAQLTALAINDLKNTYVNLNARIINDMLTDKPILTDEDYRDIRATITLLNNRLKHVLKKK